VAARLGSRICCERRAATEGCPYSYASRIKFMREFGINSRVLFR
jgi:hypothetical protein